MTRPLPKPVPLVKWAGGKRQLQDRILEVIAPDFDPQKHTYFEPFFGGGAIFFALAPQKAAASDINVGLVNVYNETKDNVEELISAAQTVEREYNTLSEQAQNDFYYQERINFNESPRLGLEQAVRFLFLNKAGFNGIYRENASGGFNVPFGKRHQLKMVDEMNLRSVNEALRQVSLKVQDYSLTVSDARQGDLVYFDPPYVPLTATSAFTGYTAEGFGPKDQIALRDLFVHLDKNVGARVALSNSGAKAVEELYAGYNFKTLKASRAISATTAGRAPVSEYLVTNF